MIAAATALALAREGSAVCVAARRTDRLAEVEAEIVAKGGRALAVPTDITDPAAPAIEDSFDGYGTARRVVVETEDLIEATRAGIVPLMGHDLAAMKRHRQDQVAFAAAALLFRIEGIILLALPAGSFLLI